VDFDEFGRISNEVVFGLYSSDFAIVVKPWLNDCSRCCTFCTEISEASFVGDIDVPYDGYYRDRTND